MLCIPFLSPQLLQYFNSIPSSYDGGDVMGTRRSTSDCYNLQLWLTLTYWDTIGGMRGDTKNVIAKQKTLNFASSIQQIPVLYLNLDIVKKVRQYLYVEQIVILVSHLSYRYFTMDPNLNTVFINKNFMVH